MTKKKSPEELAEAKRETAERRAFAKGKVAGNGVKTGAGKGKAEKASKPKADAKKTSAPKASKATGATKPKAPTGRAMAGKAQPALNEAIAKAREGLLNPNGKGDTSVSHGFSGEPLKHIVGPAPKASKPKTTVAAAITELLDDDIATRKAALKRDIDASEWRRPRTVSNTIESTAHRQHLTDRVEAETEAEEALIGARAELSKAHLETTKAPRPRCSDQRRDKQRNEVGRSHEDLDVRLTRDEQLETAESCAHYVASRARLKEAKKDVDTTLANLVKGYDERISTYSRAVETGVLSVPVVTIDLLENGEVRTIRADDGRIITKRKATQDELQPPLFGGGEGPGTSFGPTHGDEDTSDSDEEAAE